ncbi:hypothetical protein BGP_3964 [Beggiatoa sp. PS]|nr:hypothetical protein BGP_3964 [Beggiatoa sp. PS]
MKHLKHSETLINLPSANSEKNLTKNTKASLWTPSRFFGSLK